MRVSVIKFKRMKLSIEELLNELSVTEKFILLLLYAGKEGVKGPLWLQKEIFELAKSIRELAEELDFSAYSYGPWSEALTEARDMLENSGLIVSQEDGRLVLTEEGKKMAQILWHKTDEKIISLLKETREFLESLDWDELLLYIYSTSPTMADKSVKYLSLIHI